MEPDLNFLLGFGRLRIKSILETLHSNCWMQSEPVTVIQALAACAALSPESTLAALTANTEIRKLLILT